MEFPSGLRLWGFCAKHEACLFFFVCFSNRFRHDAAIARLLSVFLHGNQSHLVLLNSTQYTVLHGSDRVKPWLPVYQDPFIVCLGDLVYGDLCGQIVRFDGNPLLRCCHRISSLQIGRACSSAGSTRFSHELHPLLELKCRGSDRRSSLPCNRGTLNPNQKRCVVLKSLIAANTGHATWWFNLMTDKIPNHRSRCSGSVLMVCVGTSHSNVRFVMYSTIILGLDTSQAYLSGGHPLTTPIYQQ